MGFVYQVCLGLHENKGETGGKVTLSPIIMEVENGCI